MICPSDINSLKIDISEKIGQKILVRGSEGRCKFFEKEAIIEKVYPELFVIKYNKKNNNACYSYKDILTKSIEIDVFDGNNYSPLITKYEERIKVKKVN